MRHGRGGLGVRSPQDHSARRSRSIFLFSVTRRLLSFPSPVEKFARVGATYRILLQERLQDRYIRCVPTFSPLFSYLFTPRLPTFSPLLSYLFTPQVIHRSSFQSGVFIVYTYYSETVRFLKFRLLKVCWALVCAYGSSCITGCVLPKFGRML